VSRPDRFSGRVAVVSGGRGGIGGAIVSALQDEGARVAVLDLPAPPRPATAAGPASAAASEVPPVKADLDVDCDVTDPGSVSSAVEEVSTALGTPSLLVCAAGVVSEAPVVDLPLEEWRRVVDVSLTGTFLLLRAVLPHLGAEQGGAAVGLSSGWATKGYQNGSHYAAAKAGVEALVKSAALEAAATGVRVNAVAPGPVLTPFLDHVEDLDAFRRAREAAIPLGRVADPADVVGPVLFLLSEDSRYVTGQVLHVNGGLLMP